MMSLLMFIITTVHFLIECTMATFYEDSDIGSNYCGGIFFMLDATGYSGIPSDHMFYHS